ncbi:unnamed protein product [Brassica rapa]|uniref:RNase H type-1 domain-containing protein n=1 Tax=Brassica campestris TaxID=3711 RepID=A0A3P6B0A4_BRACM|nr:unnamed protein product [Brassica rapa]VDC89748.1 unnamed protein product [Brassica rapa]
MYREDAIVDLTLSVRDLINVNEGTWNIQRVREVIAEEDVGLVLNTCFDLSSQDVKVWGFSGSGIYNSKSGYKLAETLETFQSPPSPGLPPIERKLWKDFSSNIFGSAWIARDSFGTPLFHSRRAFPAAASTLEAELYTLGLAVNALHDLHFQRVIIEISILRSLNSFAQCQLLDAPVEVNSMAVEIASSVTRDRRLQSYVAKGGPSWLSSFLLSEARSSSI